MTIYEIVCTVVLKQNVPYIKSFATLSKALNYSMLEDPQLKTLHKDHKPKSYNFSGFYPVEKNVDYQKGRIYVFRIRCLDEWFAKQLMKAMKTTKFEVFDLIAMELNQKQQGVIRELVSITPFVITTDEGYILPEENPLEFLENRILALLEKKHHEHYGETITVQEFAHGIIKTNRVPIKIPYKSIHMLGHKVKIQVAPNEQAQKLANMALATGIGEKTSLGFGFVVANYSK